MIRAKTNTWGQVKENVANGLDYCRDCEVWSKWESIFSGESKFCSARIDCENTTVDTGAEVVRVAEIAIEEG